MSATDHRGRMRVAITGIGVKTPAGLDVDSFYARLCSGESTAATIGRFDPSDLAVRIGCEVPEFDIEPYVTTKEARRLDRVSWLLRSMTGPILRGRHGCWILLNATT